jgi:hypothetical protein
LKDFPKLQIIVQSKNGLVDMAFLDPKDAKYVPLFVMEDLLTGDRRLLKKLFYSLIRFNQPNKARGIYERHDFQSWCKQDVFDIASKIKYDPTKD